MSRFFLLLAITLIFFPTISFSQIGHNKDGDFLEFQVIQDRLVLDSSNIEKASLEGCCTVQLELTAEAGEKMSNMTQNAINQHMSMVFNKKVINTALIRSAMGGKFVVTGFTAVQAQKFIQSLEKAKPKATK